MVPCNFDTREPSNLCLVAPWPDTTMNGSHERGLAMSRLDRHVSLVQNKLAFQKFVNALAWAVLWAGVAACLGIVVWRVVGKDALPSIKWWAIGAGAIVVGAGVFGFMRRPSEIEAAVAIAERLGIKEKFS